MKTAMERFEAEHTIAKKAIHSETAYEIMRNLAKSFAQELDGSGRVYKTINDLPSWEECHYACGANQDSPLERLIHDNESSEPEEAKKFRQQVLDLLNASPTPPAAGQNPVAIVVDNNQQDGTSKVQTPPNTTLDLGTELFRRVPVSVPEGFTLVPKEPTYNMIQAANFRQVEGAETLESSSVEYALWVEVYKSMLAASPTPTEEGK